MFWIRFPTRLSSYTYVSRISSFDGAIAKRTRSRKYDSAENDRTDELDDRGVKETARRDYEKISWSTSTKSNRQIKQQDFRHRTKITRSLLLSCQIQQLQKIWLSIQTRTRHPKRNQRPLPMTRPSRPIKSKLNSPPDQLITQFPNSLFAQLLSIRKSNCVTSEVYPVQS